MPENLCYVIQPAHISLEKWKWVFEGLIEQPVGSEGYECKITAPDVLIEDILPSLLEASLVIIDLTECDDKNVFYQLGVRHSISNKTILIYEHGKGSDTVKNFRSSYVIEYSETIKGARSFKDELQRIIATIRREPQRPDNPVQRYLYTEGKLLNIIRERVDDIDDMLNENQVLKAEKQNLEDEICRLNTVLESNAKEDPKKSIPSRIQFRKMSKPNGES